MSCLKVQQKQANVAQMSRSLFSRAYGARGICHAFSSAPTSVQMSSQMYMDWRIVATVSACMFSGGVVCEHIIRASARTYDKILSRTLSGLRPAHANTGANHNLLSLTQTLALTTTYPASREHLRLPQPTVRNQHARWTLHLTC